MGLIFETYTQDLAFLASALVGYVFLKAYRLATFFERTGFKRDSLWNLFWLNVKLLALKIHFIEFLDVVYKACPQEKAVGFIQMMRPLVMIRDPELAEKILIKEFSSFHDHGVEPDLKTNPLEGHLFNMNGAEWRALRNKLSPIFTSGKLKNMYQQINDKTEKLVAALPTGEEILLRGYLSRFAIDVIGSTAFGIEAGAIENPDSEFKKMATRLFKPSRFGALKMFMRIFLPNLSKLLKFKIFDQEVNDFFFSITKQAFDHRTKTGERRGDFVDFLLQLRGKGKLEFEEEQPDGNEDHSGEAVAELVMTDELLTAQCFIFLVAGWETTASAMMFVLYNLAKDQKIQDTLRAHLKEQNIKDYLSLRDAKYLDACISESLRLHPPAGSLFRLCNKDFLLDNGSIIEKGTMVMVNSYSIQRDPKYFPEPLEFRPERFLEEGPRQPGTYTPFGDGPRFCIGQRFALMELRMAIARLVENFRIDLSLKTQIPWTLAPDDFTNDIKGGFWVTLTKIS